MRQVNLHAAEDLRLDTAPHPRPGPRDIVVKVHACGICGTDLMLLKNGPSGARCPMPLGHEAAGVIKTVGADVLGVTAGMRIVVNPMSTNAVIGCGGPEGALCDDLLVRDAALGHSIFPIPEGVSFTAAALAEPLAVARHGVERANPAAHETVVVFGAGPIGLGAAIWLRRRGVRRFAVVDINPQRLERATALGAPHVVDARDGDVEGKLKRLFGEAQTVLGEPAVDVDVYLDMAGAPSIVGDVVSMAKKHARLVITSSHRTPIPIDFHRVLRSELSITAAIGYPDELAKVMAEIGELGREAELMISHKIPFDDVLQAFETARSPEALKVVVEFAA